VMLIMFYSLSSPYLLVFGDDRVSHYTVADDFSSDAGDT